MVADVNKTLGQYNSPPSVQAQAPAPVGQQGFKARKDTISSGNATAITYFTFKGNEILLFYSSVEGYQLSKLL